MIISESWLSPLSTKNKHFVDLECGENLQVLHKPRKSNKGKPCRGGIAIVFNKLKISLKEYPIRCGQSEIIAAVGRIPDVSRKVVIIGAYPPPKMNANQTKTAMNNIAAAVLKAKTDFCDPIIMIVGDFNRKDYAPALEHYTDIKLASTKPTRGDALLDLSFSNTNDQIYDESVTHPLTSETGTESDHSIATFSMNIARTDRFEWVKFTTRPITNKGREAFKSTIAATDWSLKSNTTSEMAEELNDRLSLIINDCFPLKYHKFRSTDDPWITHKIRKMISD